MADASSVGSCDLVQDYKRDAIKKPSMLRRRSQSGVPAPLLSSLLNGHNSVVT
jgi:hypothetical protein